MAFPSVITSFSYPQPTDRLNNPSHSTLENLQSSTIGQIEVIIGLSGNNSVIGTIIGDLRSPGSNGGGHVQTANKGGTGQTSYNKGDILVGSSSSVVSKLAIGSDGAIPIADSTQSLGIRWGNPGVNVQSFISNGTWTKPTVATRVLIQAWGGGGSGAASAGASSGGGGGGGYAESWFPASILGVTENITIGAGGGGVSGTTAGNNGGTTTFGASSWISAYGGARGETNGQGGGGGGSMSGGTGLTPGDPYISGSGSNGAASSINGVFGLISGGGGGGNNTPTGGNGGNSMWGGAGGGGFGKLSSTVVNGTGGMSYMGGVGGAGGGNGGGIPGGGGGASSGGTSGSGGTGKIIVTSF